MGNSPDFELPERAARTAETAPENASTDGSPQGADLGMGGIREPVQKFADSSTPVATLPDLVCRTVPLAFFQCEHGARTAYRAYSRGGFKSERRGLQTGILRHEPRNRAIQSRHGRATVRRFAKKDTGSQRKTNTRPSRRRSFEMREGTETARSTEPTTSTISPDSSKSPGIRGRTRKT